MSGFRAAGSWTSGFCGYLDLGLLDLEYLQLGILDSDLSIWYCWILEVWIVVLVSLKCLGWDYWVCDVWIMVCWVWDV